MRSSLRVPLLALLVGALVFVVAPAAAQAFGVQHWFAANCGAGFEKCGEHEAEPALSEFFTQAGGHPDWGVSDFTLKTKFIETGPHGEELVQPEGVLQNLRVDVAPGLSTNPQAVPMCKTFGENEVAKGIFLKTTCAENSIIGINRVTVLVLIEPAHHLFIKFPLEGEVYNLEQTTGLSSLFGVAIDLEPLDALLVGTPEEGKYKGLYSHTLIEGNVEWGAEAQGTGAADYHDYFVIKNLSNELPLIQSRLVYKGNIGVGGFLTNPTVCQAVQPTRLKAESYEHETTESKYAASVSVTNCGALPFAPEFSLGTETTQQDQPDGITTTLTLPHNSNPNELDSAQLKAATVVLPEGMTLNPAAAGEVTKACTPAQARVGTPKSHEFGVECPAESKIGTATLNVPGLPEKSLEGNIYLGGPESGTITGQPYTIYINAESKRYGVDVRLKGTVTANESTGQLTTRFEEAPGQPPEQPFTDLVLSFNGGALAPIANPLVCNAQAKTTASFTPYTGQPSVPRSLEFGISGIGGGACPSPLPFSLSQSVVNQSPGYAGAKTSYTLNIQRADGQQYLSQIKTVLPEGLVGLLPTVTKCLEPQAAKGECPEISEIGKVNVAAGAGSSPYGFRGKVFLTGPYNGAPFGLSVVVPAIAGPFNLGNVVTRGTINIEPYTARVVATSSLPTIVGGIPLRIKGVSVEINKQGFLQNPTNCGVFATETTLTGIASLQPGAPTATQTLSTPFQVNNCAALAFKPAAGAATGAKTSKANGASLETTINVPAGDANVKSVVVQLPKQLPSRLTTLQKACPEATFASNPYHCPAGSFVGGVRANTPTLSVKLQGPAILVSHGGRAFPDLDLLLEGEGVRIILVGNTAIKNGITTTTFAAPPDAPVTSITVNLPTGSHSALAANGNLCTSKLVMPTTIVGQNGVTFKQNTTIKVRNCPVQVVGHKTAGNTAYLTVRTYEAGRISGKGGSLATTFRTFKQAQKAASLKVSLSSAGRRRGRPFSAKIRVGFVPKQKGKSTSVTYVTVRFS